MEAEQVFDTLVFGTSLPKLDSCLGLYLSAEALYISEIRLKGGKPSVEHLLRLPIPQKPEPGKETVSTTRTVALLNSELLGDTERLGKLLRQALDTLKADSKDVVVSLSHQFGLLRYFSIPPMDRRFWRTAVPAEAKKHIPIPFTDLMYDFQIQAAPAGPDKQPRLGVLFGVVQRRNLESLSGILKKLGLRVLGVELSPCSVERFWDHLAGPQNAAPYAHIHLEGSEAQVLIAQKGWPILFRTVPLSPEASPAERRKVDIQGSVDYTRKQQSAAPPSQIRLSGTVRDLVGWNRALAGELDIPVRVVESAKAVGLKSEEWGAYACIGGALRYLAPTTLTLDMSQFGRIGDEDRRGVYALFTMVFFAVVILGGLGAERYAQVVYAGSELGRLRRQINQMPEFRGKQTNQIDEMVRGMEKKVEAVNSMIIPKLHITHLLEIFAEDVPEAVWINELTYTSPLGEGRGTGARNLGLRGHAMGPNLVAEQDLANQFREKLQLDPRFGKIFNCGTPRTQSAAETQPGDRALTPEQLARQQENRSSFELECAYRKR